MRRSNEWPQRESKCEMAKSSDTRIVETFNYGYPLIETFSYKKL